MSVVGKAHVWTNKYSITQSHACRDEGKGLYAATLADVDSVSYPYMAMHDGFVTDCSGVTDVAEVFVPELDHWLLLKHVG
jgi:hypothetical protein